ncbi:hypothetical protein MW887_007989 [Aspergillus wentii]|nr:hypothetical protein MW887_007989 [Aspergillus wentii]
MAYSFGSTFHLGGRFPRSSRIPPSFGTGPSWFRWFAFCWRSSTGTASSSRASTTAGYWYLGWSTGIHAGIKAVGQISHGPQFINCESQRSDSPLPYPDGTMDFIIMSQVPWEKVGTIFRDLSLVQLQSVRTQLTYILE